MRNGDKVKIAPTHARVPLGPTAGESFLPVEGRDVSWSSWWAQRLRDGDVAIVPSPATAPTSQSHSKKDDKR